MEDRKKSDVRGRKSEIRRQREESWRLEERFARGWRQTKDNCGLRKWREREEVKLSVGGWRQKEESSKLKGGIVETIETFRKASGRVYENSDLG